MLQNTLQYAAKRTAFWCKTQAILVQNARHFGAKCEAKCCKTQGETHKNTQKIGGEKKTSQQPNRKAKCS